MCHYPNLAHPGSKLGTVPRFECKSGMIRAQSITRKGDMSCGCPLLLLRGPFVRGKTVRSPQPAALSTAQNFNIVIRNSVRHTYPCLNRSNPLKMLFTIIESFRQYAYFETSASIIILHSLKPPPPEDSHFFKGLLLGNRKRIQINPYRCTYFRFVVEILKLFASVTCILLLSLNGLVRRFIKFSD